MLVNCFAKLNLQLNKFSSLETNNGKEIFSLNKVVDYDDEEIPEDVFPVKFSDIRNVQQQDQKISKEIRGIKINRIIINFLTVPKARINLLVHILIFH